MQNGHVNPESTAAEVKDFHSSFFRTGVHSSSSRNDGMQRSSTRHHPHLSLCSTASSEPMTTSYAHWLCTAPQAFSCVKHVYYWGRQLCFIATRLLLDLPLVYALKQKNKQRKRFRQTTASHMSKKTSTAVQNKIGFTRSPNLPFFFSSGECDRFRYGIGLSHAGGGVEGGSTTARGKRTFPPTHP